MAPFDDSVKEEIRSRLDIAAVIGRYVELKQSGQVLKGLCPFHKEKTPSFQVNPARGFFHCFGCGKGGDVFSFVEQIEGIGFSETLSMLGEECGVEVKRHRDPDEPSVFNGESVPPSEGTSKTELLRIHEVAAGFYYNNVKSAPHAVSYFKARGLSAQTVKEFRLGYAHDGWTSLVDFCTTQKIAISALVSCGLAIQKENGRCYDRFRNRVMFPLCDLAGRVIGFAGRAMDDATMPKYLNSPETLLYKKKFFLYGLDRARQPIKEAGGVMVVEGYMDFLSLHQTGIRNVVASSGTALTPEHGQLIARFTKKLLLLFDGDAAGQSAIEKAVFTLAPLNLDITTLTLPGSEDPDSFIKNSGRDAFVAYLAKAQPWSAFIIERMIKMHNPATAAGKSAVIDAVAPLARSLRDPVIAQQFNKELSERLNLDEKVVGRKLPRGNSTTVDPVITSGATSLHYATSLEGSFLHILLAKPEFIEEARVYVLPETLTDGISGDIYSLILKVYDRDRALHNVLDSTKDPEIRRILSLLAVKEVVEEHIHEELVQKIIFLRKKYLRSRQRECRIQMKQAPTRRAELLRLLHDYTTQLQELDGGE